LQHALTLNLGFEPANATSASFDLRLQGYDKKRSRSFDAALIAKASALPGMQAVGIINNLPLRIGEDNSVVSRTDRPMPPPSERRGAIIYKISPGYLRAAGTKLLLGRDITSHDRQGAPAVAIPGQLHSATDPGTGAAGTVGLVAKAWGTQVTLDLSKVHGPAECELVAVSRTGERRVVMGWLVAAPGDGVSGHPAHLVLRGGTSIPRSDLSRVDVDVVNGRTLVSIPV